MISLRNACLALPVLALPGLLRAQAASPVVVAVVDSAGLPIPYALVNAGSRNARVADEVGVTSLAISMRDSLRLQVRRIGYEEFYGWVRPDANGRFVVSLTALANVLAAVEVTERVNTPLARVGFYERMERVHRGAIVGEFITPEELNEWNRSNVLDILQGRTHSRVRRGLVLGRGGCGMNIVIDGKFVRTMEQTVSGEAPTSINGMGTGTLPGPTLDQLISGVSVAAVEIYPSSANAPAELVPISGRGTCGIVAIWTGGRH